MIDFFKENLEVIIYLLGLLTSLAIKGLTNLISEFIKSSFGTKDKINDEKRKTYIQLINSMGVFVEGKFGKDEFKIAQRNFNVAYDYLWLWGNKEIIRQLYSFLEKSKELTALEKKQIDTVRITELKKEMETQHVEIVFLLRKDLGLSNQGLSKSDYQFFKFE